VKLHRVKSEIRRSLIRLVLIVAFLSSLAVLLISLAHWRQVEAGQRARRVAGATKIVASGDDLQTAINAAQCGDTVVLKAGGTWDGTFTLPDKNCTSSTPITLRSSDAENLPPGRVGPANAANMPRIRSLGNVGYGAAIQVAPNAGWWIIDGLEITDNAPPTALIHWLVDFSEPSTHDLTIRRCYIHQKETGTKYNRTMQRAIHFEGHGLIARWNYINVIGYFYPEVANGNGTMQMDTTALLCVGCNTVLLEDNYISTWWNQFFLGGGDTAAQNTATVTDATTSSATFSNTKGLEAGVVLRFEIIVNGKFDKTGLNDSCDGTFPSNGSTPYSAATVTRTRGATLTGADGNHYGIMRSANDNFDGYVGICSVSGETYRIARTKSASSTAGPVMLTVFETALVTSVAGSTVNFEPYGRDQLVSSAATKVSWNYGDQGLVSDITVRRNTFYVDPAFAHDMYGKKGYSPKGLYEIKNVNRFIFEGNYVLGYPAVMAIYPANQYGTAPWTTCKDVTIRNNWIAPDLGYPESTREAMTLIDAENYATVAPRRNFFVYNNLIKNVGSFASFKVSNNVQLYHNTVLNIAPSSYSYHAAFTGISAPTTNFVFRDNIVAFSAYGANCSVPPGSMGTCWPGAVFRNNVLLNDAKATAPNGGSLDGVWGRSSTLGVYNSLAALGFVDPANDDFSLAATSRLKGKGTDAKDPGVDMDELRKSLPPGGAPSPAK
jgi:hypothetical protein